MGELVRPFLKWAGNKYQIVRQIKAVLPPGQRLIEPFAGSGAVFLNVDFSCYVVADANPDLISLYQIVQQEGESFIDYCRTFFRPENNSSEVFYSIRAHFNTTCDHREKAAMFVYLNRHCYNGLCRYNAKGEFNVPFGKYRHPYFPVKEMTYFYQRARTAVFRQADFEETMDAARRGDVVYCDPPYVPLSATANFTSYSSDKFGREEQLRLAHMAEKLANRGIPVVISNHNTEFTRQAYAVARISKFDVQRYISCDGANRHKAEELLAVFAN